MAEGEQAASRQSAQQEDQRLPDQPVGGKPLNLDASEQEKTQEEFQEQTPSGETDPEHKQQQQEPQQEQQQPEHLQGQPEQPSEEDAARAAEAMAVAEALKREGNEMFGKGMWDDAAAKYNAALDAAPPSATREKAIYFANLAACNIKTEQFAVAAQHCTEAIRLDVSYQKAYMRRCEAFERLDEIDHALADAKVLLELAPDNAWARGKVAALQPRVDERTEKLKAEMLSKLKDLGNVVLGKFGLSVDNFKFDKDPNTGGYSVRFER